MFINHSAREVTAKIVYYGPGLSGKTTNLQYIFSVTNPKTRGELISIETEIERTLFFDLLPVNVGLINGYQTKFQLYTVPGQVFYDSTRKLVLKGADGVVFVADSQELMKQANLDSLENLKINLDGHKIDINDLPTVLQYNKRDLNNTLSVDELNEYLNPNKLPSYAATATIGEGVIETLRGISSLILKRIRLLLENKPPEQQNSEPPETVVFDTNSKHKIIEKEKLPLRKIQTDNLETASQELEPGQPVDSPEGEIAFEPEEFEHDLTVETTGEFEAYNDLDEIVLGDEDAIAPVEGLEEIDIGGDSSDSIELEPFEIEPPADLESTMPAATQGPQLLEVPEVPFQQDTPEQDNTKRLDTAAKLDLPDPGDQAFLNEIDDIKGLDDVPHEETIPFPDAAQADETEELQLDLSAAASPPMVEMDLGDVKPAEDELLLVEEVLSEPAPADPPQQTAPPVEPGIPIVPEPPRELKEIQELRQSLTPGKPANKNPKPADKVSGLDLFDRLKDKSRVTVIKEIPASGNRITVDIKSADDIVESLDITITPETKKITLILDLKK